MRPLAVSRWLTRCALLALLAAPSLLLAQDDEEFFEFEPEEAAVPPVADPLQGLNRLTFAFNDKLYRGVLKPVARGLRVLPEPVRTAGSNFFNNLGAPVSAFSALLQGEFANAGTEALRFLLNSTAGMAGLADVATRVGLAQDEEDLGQTLARYGLGHGFYLVLPFYGSSSLRDTIGTVATSAVNPVYDNLDTGEIIAINLTAAELALSLDKDTYEALYDSAIDPYSFFRSAWQQNRAGQVEK